MNYYTQLDNVIRRIKQLRPDLVDKLAQVENEIENDGALKMYQRAAKSAQNSYLLSQWKPQVEKRISAYLMKLNMLSRELPSSMNRYQMGWPFSDEELSPEQKHDTGIEILQAFYDEAKHFSDFNFNSFEEFEAYLESKVPGYAQNIGDLVAMNVASTTVGDAKNRVADLARQSRGLANVSAIVQAAGGTGDSINWWQAIPEVAIQTGKDVATQGVNVLSNVGTGVLSTLKAAKYLPLILGAAGIGYLFLKGGGLKSLGKR